MATALAANRHGVLLFRDWSIPGLPYWKREEVAQSTYTQSLLAGRKTKESNWGPKVWPNKRCGIPECVAGSDQNGLVEYIEEDEMSIPDDVPAPDETLTSSQNSGVGLDEEQMFKEPNSRWLQPQPSISSRRNLVQVQPLHRHQVDCDLESTFDDYWCSEPKKEDEEAFASICKVIGAFLGPRMSKGVFVWEMMLKVICSQVDLRDDQSAQQSTSKQIKVPGTLRRDWRFDNTIGSVACFVEAPNDKVKSDSPRNTTIIDLDSVARPDGSAELMPSSNEGQATFERGANVDRAALSAHGRIQVSSDVDLKDLYKSGVFPALTTKSSSTCAGSPGAASSPASSCNNSCAQSASSPEVPVWPSGDALGESATSSLRDPRVQDTLAKLGEVPVLVVTDGACANPFEDISLNASPERSLQLNGISPAGSLQAASHRSDCGCIVGLQAKLVSSLLPKSAKGSPPPSPRRSRERHNGDSVARGDADSAAFERASEVTPVSVKSAPAASRVYFGGKIASC